MSSHAVWLSLLLVFGLCSGSHAQDTAKTAPSHGSQSSNSASTFAAPGASEQQERPVQEPHLGDSPVGDSPELEKGSSAMSDTPGTTTATAETNTAPVAPSESTPDAGKTSTYPLTSERPKMSEVSNWPMVMLTLVGIVAAIFLLAWMAKRFGGMSAMGLRGMKVVSVLPLGTREKVALIDVNGQQILLGVTAHNINHLHTFDKTVIETQSGEPGDFSQKLQSLLSGQKQNKEAQEDV